MLIISYIGDQVWLMTSRQTDPELGETDGRVSDRNGNTMAVNGVIQFIDVRVEDPVDKTDAWTLVGILIW